METVWDKAKTIDEIPAWIKLCLYGPQGAGKTALAATAPKPAWIDFERSSETLRSMPVQFHSIPILKPDSMDDVFEAVKDFPNSPYETLVLDTGTNMQFFQLREEMVKAKKKNASRDIYLPLFQEFRISSEMLYDIFVKLQDMEKHVIVICHEKEEWEVINDTKVLMNIRPDLTPAVASKLNGLLNFTGRLEYKAGMGSNPAKRILTVNPSGKITAKNRLGIQETSIENPILEKIFTESYKLKS